MKNSEAFTVPMTFLGSILLLSKVVVTTGPQPPPPAASMNPPVAASGIMLEFFCLKYTLIFLKAFMYQDQIYLKATKLHYMQFILIQCQVK